MKYKTILIRLSIILLAFFNAFCLGAVKNSKKDGEVNIIPFDISMKRIPVKFQTNDCQELYTKLDKLSDKISKRDEFETQEEFQKRVKNTLEKISKPLCCFQSSAPSSYDIDSQELQIDCQDTYMCRSSLTLVCNGKQVPPEIAVIKLDKYTQNYVGRNDYGLEFDVEGKFYDYYGIFILNKNDKNLMFSIKLPKDEAKSLKENLGILYIGNINCEETSNKLTEFVGWSTKKPTTDNPKFWSFGYYTIYFRLKELWVYNKSTGTIMFKEQF